MVLCKYYRVASVIDDAGIKCNKDVKDGGKLTEQYSHPLPADGSSVLPPNKHTHSQTHARTTQAFSNCTILLRCLFKQKCSNINHLIEHKQKQMWCQF